MNDLPYRRIRQFLIAELWVSQGGQCNYCHRAMLSRSRKKGSKLPKPNDITIDHVVPISKGGSNMIDNIVLACRECNNAKGNLLMSQWKPENQTP